MPQTDPLYELMSRGAAKRPKEPDTLNVIDENADKCCRKALTRLLQDPTYAAQSNRFECGVCGTEMFPTMEGPLRVWRIQEHFAVHRR